MDVIVLLLIIMVAFPHRSLITPLIIVLILLLPVIITHFPANLNFSDITFGIITNRIFAITVITNKKLAKRAPFKGLFYFFDACAKNCLTVGVF
ncbi:MAG: hypothetical protein A2V73_00015 [candidate division Zixibacteria bacterium RBG_19FT_COMBO_42_43]|nr:MAG: hypothetical protein A2V73_00015 [candidate division Zixibacteria bacterium RBG_19FT_COMBO_42_43]